MASEEPSTWPSKASEQAQQYDPHCGQRLSIKHMTSSPSDYACWSKPLPPAPQMSAMRIDSGAATNHVTCSKSPSAWRAKTVSPRDGYLWSSGPQLGPQYSPARPVRSSSLAYRTSTFDASHLESPAEYKEQDVELVEYPCAATMVIPDQLPPRPQRPARASRVLHSSLRELKRISLTSGDTADQGTKARAFSSSVYKHERNNDTAGSITSTTANTTHILPQHHIRLPASGDPQNGRTAWLHALTAFLVVLNCWGLNSASGLFQAYYAQHLLPSSSPSSIAWIGSTQLSLVFLLGMPIGRLVTPTPTGRTAFRAFFSGGSVLLGLSVLLTAECSAWWSLWLTQGVLTGLGMGCVFCSGVVVLLGWFSEDRLGVAMGAAAAGSCVGAVAYTLLAEHALRTLGFRATMRVLAAVVAVTLVPPNVVFRVRKEGRGVGMCGARELGRRQAGNRGDWRECVDKPYLLLASGMFFSFLGLYFGFVFIISYASTVVHLSETSSVNLLIYMMAANLPGRFLPALISDRCIGPLNTMIPSTLLSAAVVGLWAASTPSKASLIVVACFYGFSSAGVQVLYAPTVYAFCAVDRGGNGAGDGRTERTGVRAGGVFTCIGFACLIGTPIGGALINYRFERGLGQPYLGAQIFASGCLLVGGLLLLASRVARSGWLAVRV